MSTTAQILFAIATAIVLSYAFTTLFHNWALGIPVGIACAGSLGLGTYLATRQNPKE